MTATDELRKALAFMRIWLTEDAHLGESAISRELEKAEGLRKLDAIEQAIAATLGRGTCEYAIKDNMNETEGVGDVWIECSACHCTFDYYGGKWLMNMNYCPYCGAQIERREQ